MCKPGVCAALSTPPNAPPWSESERDGDPRHQRLAPKCTCRDGCSTAVDDLTRERATFSLICGSTGHFNIFQIPSMWMTVSKLTAVTIVSAGILKRPSDMIPITTSSASVVPDSWLRGCSDSNLAVTCPDGFHKVTLHCGGALFRGTLQT